MRKNNIQLLKIFNFFIGFSFFAPIAIIYFSNVAGSYTLGASIFGIIMLSAAIFEVPTGIWSDKVGRRGTIILGSWALLIAFALYALANSYALLVIGAVFEGLSRSFYSGNNDAFLFESSNDLGMSYQYNDILGKTRSMEHIGIALGAVIGGFIATYSLRFSVFLTCFSTLGTLVCTIYD